MPKFRLHYERKVTYDFVVEAEDEMEAREIANDEFYDRLYDDEIEVDDTDVEFCYAKEIEEGEEED